MAAAQPVATLEESIVEGPGHQVGEGSVIHPKLSLEAGVIDNLFYEESDPVITPVVKVIGGFSIASQNAPKPVGEMEPMVQAESETSDDPEVVTEPPPPSAVDYRLGAQVIFLGFPSTNERARKQTDFAGGLDGQVIINPGGQFTVAIADQFLRDAQPHNFESFGNLNRDYNHGEIGAMYKPGAGVLGFGLRYENTIDRFESSDASFANRIQHLIAARAEWKWLPITKFYFDASYGFFGSLGDAGSGFKSGSNPLRIQLGIGTALTWSTFIVAHAGYGNGFYDTGESFNMAIGGLMFGWRYAPYGRLRLVADYDFQDSLQANYFTDITLRGMVDQQFGMFILSADAGVKLRGYRGIPAVIGPPTRDDVIFSAAAKLAYMMRDNFALYAKLRALIDETDYMYSAPPTTDTPKFRRFEGVVGATLAF